MFENVLLYVKFPYFIFYIFCIFGFRDMYVLLGLLIVVFIDVTGRSAQRCHRCGTCRAYNPPLTSHRVSARGTLAVCAALS